MRLARVSPRLGLRRLVAGRSRSAGTRPRRAYAHRLAQQRRAHFIRLPLVLPIVLFVLLIAAVMIGFEERSFRDQSRRQLHERGTTALAQVGRELGQLRRAHETFARLLTNTPGLVPSVKRADTGGLRKLLSPIKANQAFEEITVYGADGTQLLELGPPKGDRIDAAVFARALTGRTSAETVIDPAGLVVLAATPIVERGRIAGVLVVASTLTSSDLSVLKRQGGLELAFFQGESLVATSATRPGLVETLRNASVSDEGLPKLNAGLRDYQLSAAVGQQEGGAVVALAPSGDLQNFERQHRLVVMAAAGLLLVALPLIAYFLTRTVVRPLRAMAIATRRMIEGDFTTRVAASRIPEVDAVATGVNYLAERVESQLRDLTHQAFHDGLTDLPNRALFLDRLDHALARAHRSGRSVVVIFVDLDNFKLVNDALGHPVADQLLVEVGDRFAQSVRAEDTLARLGGDEFTVLLEDVDQIEDALPIVERLEEALHEPFQLSGREVFTTASFGITISAGTTDAAHVMREADLAMYRAKASGKARYEIFDETMSAVLEERLALQTELRRAIDAEQFELHYQPIIELATGSVVAVEALVRWQHPKRGRVAPGEFIPLAEETGLIVPLGRFVLHEACRQLKAWQLEDRTDWGMSINLSPRQFQDGRLVADVERILEETGLDPRRLTLEITESLVVHDDEAALAKITALSELGVGFVIDDFGVGYSSLSYLKRLPVDGLKIDKSFVDGLGRSAEDVAIVRAIIMFAKALGLSVTGEGVEERLQATQLASLGCDCAQGYHFARPAPAEEIRAAFLRPSVGARPAA